MNFSKSKIALYNISRVSFVIIYITYATLYVGTSLGRWNIPHGLLETLNIFSFLLYITDFIVVIVMFVNLLRSKLSEGDFIGKTIRIILGVNLVVKVIMLLIWLNLVVIYSAELDLIYYVLEACFVLTTIVLFNDKKEMGNN
jgi:hypothetical protein